MRHRVAIVLQIETDDIEDATSSIVESLDEGVIQVLNTTKFRITEADVIVPAKESTTVAATKIKEYVARKAAISVEAKFVAEFLACAFADYFTELDERFDTDAFFRECCLREVFIERMAKARSKFEQKKTAAAWREAERVVKQGNK